MGLLQREHVPASRTPDFHLPAGDLRFIDFQFCAAITRNDHGYLNFLPPPNDTSLRLKSPTRSMPATKPAMCAYHAIPPAAPLEKRALRNWSTNQKPSTTMAGISTVLTRNPKKMSVTIRA